MTIAECHYNTCRCFVTDVSFHSSNCRCTVHCMHAEIILWVDERSRGAYRSTFLKWWLTIRWKHHDWLYWCHFRRSCMLKVMWHIFNRPLLLGPQRPYEIKRDYKLSIPNIRNTFIILSCPFCTQNRLNSSGHGVYKVSKVFHRDAGPCWLQCFPQLFQVDWMSFGGWTILDTHGKRLSVKNPAALQFLTQTSAPGTYYHSLFKET